MISPIYEMLDALVQEQPAEALAPEIGGQFAAIGIVKGKKFNPDARMRKILHRRHRRSQRRGQAVELSSSRNPKGSAITPLPRNGSNPLFVGGYDFTRPPPEITKEGVEAIPPIPAPVRSTRAPPSSMSRPASRLRWWMRLPDVGSQYLFAYFQSRAGALRRRQDL